MVGEIERSGAATTAGEARAWRAAIMPYQRPDARRSAWQIATSVTPYLAVTALMYWSLSVSYLLTLALGVLAGGFLLRIFIIFHDCCHGSFFRSRRANHIVGAICGFFVFTPFHKWRHDHAIHHATTGDLDQRGRGDVYTMTVAEYREATPWQRLHYRLYRHPLVFLGVGPLYIFLISNRLPMRGDGPREHRSIMLLNAALVAYVVVMSLTVGLPAFLLVQLPAIGVAATVGIWLFYVQHQFEDAYWSRGDAWDYAEASLQGSTYLKLPRVLQWFSGNIGLHHVHHLSSRIPNYRLEDCHAASPLFSDVPTITIRSSVQSLSLSLWDEEREKLISFREEALARQATPQCELHQAD